MIVHVRGQVDEALSQEETPIVVGTWSETEGFACALHAFPLGHMHSTTCEPRRFLQLGIVVLQERALSALAMELLTRYVSWLACERRAGCTKVGRKLICHRHGFTEIVGHVVSAARIQLLKHALQNNSSLFRTRFHQFIHVYAVNIRIYIYI